MDVKIENVRGCESVRSERVAIRRKGGRTVCGRGLGLVCLSECGALWGVVSGRSSHGFASVARASDTVR